MEKPGLEIGAGSPWLDQAESSVDPARIAAKAFSIIDSVGMRGDDQAGASRIQDNCNNSFVTGFSPLQLVFRHKILDRNGALHRCHDGGKLQEGAVANGLVMRPPRLAATGSMAA
jgi:hypothetical protein